MKFLVALLSVVACACADQLVTYPNGAVAPVETPDVQLAKAAHFAAHGAAAPYAYAAPYGYNAGLAYAPALPLAAGLPLAYNNFGYLGLVAHPNGAVVPVDEPAVQAARAEHLKAHGVPIGPAPVAPYAAGYGYPGLVAHPNGALVPVEPADVIEARNAHLAAHGK